jgi:Raf kinase inhibitor-like YbhB/YbcL family protein
MQMQMSHRRVLTNVAASASRVAVVTAALVTALATTSSTAQAQATAATAVPAAQPPRANPGRGAMRIMTLTSPQFTDGGMMPAAQTQPGRDHSPALQWSGAPDSTRSFVLIVHDLDAALGDGTDDLLHWMVWNIPGSATSLPAGIPSGSQTADGLRQISASGPYYRGPAAPSTGPAHHYAFELYALDIAVNVQPATLSPPLTRAEVMRTIAQHVRGKGVLIGLYRRPAP